MRGSGRGILEVGRCDGVRRRDVRLDFSFISGRLDG